MRVDGALPNKVVKESGGAPRRPFSLLRLVLALLAGLGISYLFYWMGDILGLSRADVLHRVGWACLGMAAAVTAFALWARRRNRFVRACNANSSNSSNAANATYTPTNYTAVIDAASGSDLGKKIAKFACQYIGGPYVAGGTSLTGGADCSGFTYRVYSEFGYSLARTSTQQRSAGTGVNYSNAQPGDLIC